MSSRRAYFRGDPVRRFWFYVRKDTTSDCWAWTGYLDDDGYGRIWDGQRRQRAHRFSYELHVGPIPDGLVIDHLCRNILCVNPDHLEPVTDRVNILRGTAPTAKHAIKTGCVNGHPFSPENTYTYGPDNRWRKCRECMRINDRKTAARKRAMS